MKFLVTTFLVLLIALAAWPVSAGTLLEEGLNTTAQQGNLIPESDASKSATELGNITLGKVINAILAFVGVLFMIVVIYAGLLWMTAGGNPDQVQKAKRYLVNAVVGLALVALSYAITNYLITTIGSQTQQ